MFKSFDMKKLINFFKGLAVVMTVIFASSSCTKVVSESSAEEKILGVWTLEHINVQNYENDKLMSEKKMYATEGTSLTMEFKEGGEGCALNLDATNPSPEPYKWKLIGNSLILFFDSDATHIDVWSLTNERLDLSLMNETYEAGVRKGVRYIISLTK